MLPPFRRSPLTPPSGLVWAGALLAWVATMEVSPGCDACVERLIDPLIEPPTQYSPDYAEGEIPKASAPAVAAKGTARPASRQPTGALSGRIVFTNGGHGWTWDPDYWRVQRGVQQEMNEDYGNLDQMNFFAAWCFNAGAVVVPMRPLGYQVNEVVLDNDSPGVVFAGPWSNSVASVFFGSGGDVPYRFAGLAATETATATYTPDIPETGTYPVYTWVRHGSDRGHQLYRIRHTGGESEVRIPHHMVGNGWVYLGEYYFRAGAHTETGAVVVSNLRATPTGGVVIADAIRFGNGMGSVNRGNGLSTYPREEESCRYWFQASLGQGQSSTLYDGGGNDESDSWSAPAKMSAEMNREAAGSMFDRIHISFHTNAGGGRGTLALITSDPTPHQSRLAQICASEVNADLVALGSPPLEVPWQNRSTLTYTGGYSEITGSFFNYEMDATIIEVAFHDSAEDARLLRSVEGRDAVGKAAMHAVVRYRNEFDGGPLAFAPDPPSGLRAEGMAGGSVVLRWTPPVATGGSGAPTGYVVYRSADGYGFGDPLEIGNVTQAVVAGSAPGTDQYFRVAAVNAGGESFPSEVAGCRVGSSGRRQVLVVNAFDRADRSLNLRQDVTRLGYAPPDATGAIERVLPRRSNGLDYVVPHGKALTAAGYSFDSCQNEHILDGQVFLSDYAVVVWASGQESTADETFALLEQSVLSEFRAGGGHLFVSGSEIAWDLDRASGPSQADRDFLRLQLGADYVADDSGSDTLVPSPGGLFDGMTAFTFDDGTRGLYPVRSPDVIVPMGGDSRAALAYPGSGTAAIQRAPSEGLGGVVYLAVPFETITGEATRAEVMRRALDFLTRPRFLVESGSSWRFLDTGAVPSAAWTALGFDDASWASGSAQLGFGEGDESTLLANDPTRTTTWIRGVFQVEEEPDPSELRLRLLRDDGALVWLNGVELARSNLPPSGPILPSTQALAAVGGADENVFITHGGDADLLRRGTNVLAVELHQAGLASSDLSFDLELAAMAGNGALLVPSGAFWRYRDSGVSPPESWKEITYDDAAWAEGAARLGYGGDGEVTVVSGGTTGGNAPPVTWFRHTFSLENAGAFEALQVELQRDDGAVVWLNGNEILRDNLASGVLLPTTLATTGVGGTEERAWRRFVVPATDLRTGSNVLAVQIHQASPTSSDIGFDLRLSGLATAAITFADWQAAMFGSDATNPALAGDTSDPDRDGRVNLMEYATGTWPDSPDSEALPVLEVLDERLAIRFPRNTLATDLTWLVQAAESLAGPWITIAAGMDGAPLQASLPGILVTEAPIGSVREVEIQDLGFLAPEAPPQRFLRLAVTR